jgi:hypothetical protein
MIKPQTSVRNWIRILSSFANLPRFSVSFLLCLTTAICRMSETEEIEEFQLSELAEKAQDRRERLKALRTNRTLGNNVGESGEGGPLG